MFYRGLKCRFFGFWVNMYIGIVWSLLFNIFCFGNEIERGYCGFMINRNLGVWGFGI